MEHAGDTGRKRMRDRKAAVATVLAVLVGLPALYFGPLVVQYLERDSPQAAIARADKYAMGSYAYSLGSEYTDEEGRTVYRLVSDTDPVIVQEVRYELFRWFPEYRGLSAIAPIPEFGDPGPYYEVVNEDEWYESLDAWSEERKRRDSRADGGSRTGTR